MLIMQDAGDDSTAMFVVRVSSEVITVKTAGIQNEIGDHWGD